MTQLLSNAIIVSISLGFIGAIAGVISESIFKLKSNKWFVPFCSALAIVLTRTLTSNTSILTNSHLNNSTNYNQKISRLEMALSNNGLKKIISSPMWEQKKAQSSLSDFEFAQQIVMLGQKRLDYDQLLIIQKIKFKLSKKSTKLCASLWTGNADKGLFSEKLNNLPENDLNAFGYVTVEAIRRELNEFPYAIPEVNQINNSILKVKSIRPKSYNRFMRNIQADNQLSQKEACWTYQIFSEAISKLDRKYSNVLLRLQFVK